MKKLYATVLLLSMAGVVQAQQYTATVVDADCEVVSTTTSAAGAIGGSAVGGVAGAVVGDALFGRTGRILGGFLGSGGGAVIGEKALAEKTYRCVLTVDVPAIGKVYTESLGKVRNIGSTVVLAKTASGDYLVKG